MQGTLILLKPLSGPLSCATGAADSPAHVCDLWIMEPAAVTLLGRWLATALG
jgi:hypothetical protein